MTSLCHWTRDRIFPERISRISVNKLADTRTFVHTLIKRALLFLCSEFSGVHCINPTCYRHILQTRHRHCKGTHFLIFLLKILKDCDNLISLGKISYTFGPRNEMDSVSCVTGFTLRVCSVSFRRKLYGCERSTNISLKTGGEKPCKTL